jgi:queuine tRNA-ribosyltransferase
LLTAPFKFEVLARDAATHARLGRISTPHGTVETPAFMPVGTCGTVKGVTQDQLEQLGAQIILANTYHLYLRPGSDVIRQAGGLHRFMSWPHPILTDSGGFQVMSLESLRRITEEGVDFRSHLDGSRHFLSPERAVEIQIALGSDIMMILDECIAYPASLEATRRSVALTGRWARRAREIYRRSLDAADSPPGGALYGIVQGGLVGALRRESAQEMQEIGFEGYAMGGLSVGEPKPTTYEVVKVTAQALPDASPRYLMGVGTPRDLIECVALGIDQFDCVMPTRNARNACAFTSEGRLVVKSARYMHDDRPLDERCACSTCRRYSRAYLRHLFASGEMLGAILTTVHNLFFYLDTMREIRQAIGAGNFASYLSRRRDEVD